METERFGGFTDKIIQARIHKRRNRFLDSITKPSILDLARTYRPGSSCEFFKDPERGSYNVCYFVEFDDGERCVVRIPLAPCLSRSAKSKLESEIATMQLVAEKTTIPIPRILSYGLSDSSDPLSSYLILEYIDGHSILPAQLQSLTDKQQQCLYTSLANIYIQLRQLTFPSINCLTKTTSSVEPRKRLMTININRQELEQMQPFAIQSKYTASNTISSANSYTEMLLEFADNALKKSQDRILDQEQGEDVLYHHHLFRRFAAEEWMDRGANNGPFVLVHGDLRLANCLVNDQKEIISVLDWEWSRVVPRQFFLPPLWLTNRNPEALAWDFAFNRFLDKLNTLLGIMRETERAKYGNELLSDEWAKGAQGGAFLVANALENWTDMDAFAVDYINRVWFKGTGDVAARVANFIQSNPTQAPLVKQLCQAHQVYETELEALREDGDEHSADAMAQGDGNILRAGNNGTDVHIRTMTFSISPLSALVTLATLAIVGVFW